MWSFKNNGGRAYPKLSMGPLLYQYAIAWALLFFKLLVDPEIQQHIYHLNIVQAEAFINHQLTQKELDVSFVDVTLHNFQSKCALQGCHIALVFHVLRRSKTHEYGLDIYIQIFSSSL